jgi:hypothetical protein
VGTHPVSAGIAKREIDLRHKIVFVLVALPPSRPKLGCLLAYQSLGLGLCKNFGGCVKMRRRGNLIEQTSLQIVIRARTMSVVDLEQSDNENDILLVLKLRTFLHS